MDVDDVEIVRSQVSFDLSGHVKAQGNGCIGLVGRQEIGAAEAGDRERRLGSDCRLQIADCRLQIPRIPNREVGSQDFDVVAPLPE